MPDTKHKQIFDAMVTAITAISGITVDSVLKQFEDITDKAKLPWVGLFPITAIETTGTTTGSSGKQAETDWVALVYVQETDPLSKMLEIYGNIKAALETDPTLGLAFVNWTHVREGNFAHFSEQMSELGGGFRGEMEITIQTQHRHSRDVP
jgi:hypothetical protein